MQQQSSPQAGQEPNGGAAPSAATAEEAVQPNKKQGFPLDVAPDDVTFMIRFRHALRDSDTQIRILEGHEQLRKVAIPAGYIIDALDVIGTRWDGHAPGGIHRVVCLLERRPDENSNLRYLIVVDQGDVIRLPPGDSDIKKLTGFRLFYTQGSYLPLP